MPSLINDGKVFFPNVISDQVFQADGILFGSEAGGSIGLHWAVIDPRKHILYLWEKDRSDFVAAAAALGSSVVTNGSFNQYRGGNRYASSLKTYAWLTWATLKKIAVDFSGVGGEDFWDYSYDEECQRIKTLFWAGEHPDGYLFGEREHINIANVSRPNGSHFGRRAGRQFEDYVIGTGDSPRIAEVMGALFRSVNNYAVVDPYPSGIGAGFWGLAPLNPADPIWQESGLDSALERLLIHDPSGNLPPLTGLLITAFYWGPPPTVAAFLASALVKDAVRIDGNDSILLGHGTEIIVGTSMPDHKRLYNRWGFQCRRE
jgi:hypothetical protein